MDPQSQALVLPVAGAFISEEVVSLPMLLRFVLILKSSSSSYINSLKTIYENINIQENPRNSLQPLEHRAANPTHITIYREHRCPSSICVLRKNRSKYGKLTDLNEKNQIEVL